MASLTWSAVRPAAAKASASVDTSQPSGKKNMLAMLCSKPAATKAVMGRRIPIILSTSERPATAIHTARHTSMLASSPRTNAVPNDRFTLSLAIWMVRTENA